MYTKLNEMINPRRSNTAHLPSVTYFTKRTHSHVPSDHSERLPLVYNSLPVDIYPPNSEITISVRCLETCYHVSICSCTKLCVAYQHSLAEGECSY